MMGIVGQKGYRTEEEIRAVEKEILEKVWEKDDEPKTLIEVCHILGVDRRNKSTVYRYLERMVEKRTLIKEGKGRGATYRPNRARVLSMNHVEFFLKKVKESEKTESLQTFTQGMFDVSILGLAKNEKLNEYEQFLLDTFLEEVTNAWTFLYGLKEIISIRKAVERHIEHAWMTQHALFWKFYYELIDAYALSPAKIQEVLETLKEALLKKYLEFKLVSPREEKTPFDSFDKLMKKYDLQKFGWHRDYPLLDKNKEKIANTISEEVFEESENLGFLVTLSIKASSEYWENIENPIIDWVRIFQGTAEECKLTKFEELAGLIKYIAQSCLTDLYFISPRKVRRFEDKMRKEKGTDWEITIAKPREPVLRGLTEDEKARLRDLDLLLKRYGEEGIEVIIETLDKLKGTKVEDLDFLIVDEKLEEVLKKKGLLKRYAREHFY